MVLTMVDFDKETIMKLANKFLLIGIIGVIQFVIMDIFIALDVFLVFAFLFDDTIRLSLDVVISLILFYILKNGLEELGTESAIDMKYYRNANRFLIFYPICSGLTIGLDFIFLLSIPSLSITYFIIIIALLILGYIGLICMGVHIYKIGGNMNKKLIVIGGIILILSPWIAGILLFFGLKDLYIDYSE
ncbi:MAG: hypothetical protein EU547_07440 [Promethearchaeota archaeon]|nr:MAG: hypothetical protein EU547_07440 [Candidatus Lokiarchaeota archaeon]